MKRNATAIAVTMTAVLAGCQSSGPRTARSDAVCDPPAVTRPLPDLLEETSGVAASRTHEGVFWTHNDSGGDPAVFAVDSTGTLLARIRLPGISNRDWEDIGIGPCEPGGATCLFLGDIGDNNERHERIAVYRIPEPDPATDTVSAGVAVLLATYPGGPRDAEGLFVTDAGIHIVNKGRSDAIDLFRLPPPYDTSATVALQRVQRLAPPPTSVSAQVTAAAVDPTGDRAAIRTYSSIRFFAVEADTLRPLGGEAGMVAPAQLQGEGLDFIGPDLMVLTGEAQASRPATLVIVACDPLRAPQDTVSEPGA